MKAKEFGRYAGVAVKNGDKILLCKRNSHQSFPGMWSIPAGSIEDGEDAKEAAYREFYEETNIKLTGGLSFCGVVPRMNRDNDELKGMMYVYKYNTKDEITPDLENAKDGEEHTECGYFSLEECSDEKCGRELYKLIQVLLK
jgi:ADP-ribose pyrophosphatase YjhB (NUDIX family)